MKIVKIIIQGKIYFYLEHSYRDNFKKIKKKRQYLGKNIPSNISEIKKKFMDQINTELWYDNLDNIKNEYIKEFSKLPFTAKKKEKENFLIKFTYNTNRIEGCTITLKETARLLQERRSPVNKPLKDIKEIENHEQVFKSMLNEKNDLSLSLINRWHKKLLANIDEEIAGKIRKHNVAIAGSKFEPPQPNEIQYLLRRFIQWYNNSRGQIHPVELAAIAHLKFVTIHPFTDGNGRTSRIIMNFILHKNNFPMLDISYLRRNSYYNSLERSQIKNEDRIFVSYIIRRYLKDYKRFI